MPEAETTMFDRDSVGVAKGRPTGYAAVFPATVDYKKLEVMTKTIPELIKENGGASLGYISEDGVEYSTDTDSDDHKEWGGGTVSSEMTSYAESAKVTFLESSLAVLKTVYGDDNVTVSGADIRILHNANFTSKHTFVFDAVIGSTKVKRDIIPMGQILERDSVTTNSSDLLGYTPTIKCLPFGEGESTQITHVYDAAKAASMASAEEGDPVAVDQGEH